MTLQIGVALPRFGGTGIGVNGFVSLLTRESLVGIGWDGRPTPRVAAEWQSDPTGRRIRIRLDRRVKFHDGTPLTSDLLRDAFLKAIKNPAEPPPLSYSSITDVTIVDDDEFDIILSRPEAFLLTDLIGLSVVHPSQPDLGTGPYRRVRPQSSPSDTPQDYAQLEAFGEYYRGKPATQHIDVKAYETQRNSWAALMRGEINALHEVSPGAMDFVERESDVRTYQVLRGYYSYLAFNVRHPVLARREVRQALSQAIDREQVVKRMLHGRGEPADSPIWPYHWAYSTAHRRYTYNPEAARLRLDAAGFTMPTHSEPGRMPSRLRFTCLIFDDQRFEEAALVLQKQLFDIGVDMQIDARPAREFVDMMVAGKFDAVITEITSGRSVGWAYYAWHSKGSPYAPKTGYEGADVVLDRLRHAVGDQEIRAAVGELQRTLYEDPPAVFIAWPHALRAVSSDFVVPRESNNQDILGNVWQWQVRPPAEVARR